jgi:predicted nucleotidyltransferase
VLVEFEEPVGLFEFMDLENHLSDLLGVMVDLVSKKAFNPPNNTKTKHRQSSLKTQNNRKNSFFP